MKQEEISRQDAKTQRKSAKKTKRRRGKKRAVTAFLFPLPLAFLGVLPLRLCAFAGDSSWFFIAPVAGRGGG
jgi:hypothetical protein